MSKKNKKYIIERKGKYVTNNNAQAVNMGNCREKACKFTCLSAQNFIKHCVEPKERSKYIIIPAYEKSDPNKLEKFEWEEQAKDFSKFFSKLVEYKENLKIEGRKNEAEICDIYHYIEFFNLNAAKGFTAYKMLQKRLRKRRNIKNELWKIKIFTNSIKNETINPDLSEKLKKVDNQQYSARILKELFDV